MTCYAPLQGWRSAIPNSNGKYPITFDRHLANPLMPLDLPCGHCIGCRLAYSKEWAIRCMHEASMHESNYFITLTYSPEFLPSNLSLDKRVFTLFMKKLRKEFGSGIRFYMCGEYGDKQGRPHYHAILFNIKFDDLKFYKKNKDGSILYNSQTLSDLWGYGYAVVGNVTFESCAYVARYIVKKQKGANSDKHYQRVNLETGEIYDLVPEFCNMSRNGGIGLGWFEQNKNFVFPRDKVFMRGKELNPPKFYLKKYEAEFPNEAKEIRLERKRNAKLNVDFGDTSRLNVKMQVKLAQIKSLKRSVE